MKKHINHNNPELSVVVLSYNTKKLLNNCLKALEHAVGNFAEVIVVDNFSNDGSVDLVKKKFGWVTLIENSANLGFSAGNNMAKEVAKGKYILFLNSDTLVPADSLSKSLEYIKQNKDIGAVTCKMVLPNGELDKDARRSFPTPWVALTHLVLPFDRLFPKSKIFSRYWYGYISPEKTHEIDVAQGAYVMIPKKLLDSIGWFDEDYFLDGEDIDLSYRIKKKGYKIVYYPEVEITHVKKASKKNPSKENRKKFAIAGMDSMELFYRKHFMNKYPAILNLLVLVGIRAVKYARIIKISFK